MEIHSIGFTKHSAGEFFGKLRAARTDRLIDVRLNNVSQLAGFAKRADLEFFLEEICGARYIHESALAPTKDLLDGYKKGSMAWSEYEDRFLTLMQVLCGNKREPMGTRVLEMLQQTRTPAENRD